MNTLSTERPWEMDASQYRAMMGVHAPWIGEISPYQYSRMSKRQQKGYDARRRQEWDASANVQREWQDQVWGAYEKGVIDLETPGLHPDARWVIQSRLMAKEKEAREEALHEALQQNRIDGVEDVQVGDRVFDVMTHAYGVVTRRFRSSVRLKISEELEMTVPARQLQWKSYDDVREAFDEGRPLRPER